MKKVPDNVIAATETLDLEELSDVLYGFRTVDVDPTVALSVEIKALRDDVFRNFFLTLPYQYMGDYLRTTSTYIVSEDDLKKFETLLSNKSNNCSHGGTNAVCSNTTA